MTHDRFWWWAGFQFSVAPPWTYFLCDKPAVYLFCRRQPLGVAILYAGETSNVATRLGPSHEHWDEAVRDGMNEIHAYLNVRTENERREIEATLIGIYNPPLNRNKPANTLADPARLLPRQTGRGSSTGLLGRTLARPSTPLGRITAAPEPSNALGLLGNLPTRP